MLLLSNNKYTKLPFISLALIFSAANHTSYALANTSDKASISGFIALGQATTTANNFLGDNNDSAVLIEAGAKLAYDFSNNWSFSAQVGYREFGDSLSDDSIRLDYAALSYVSNDLGWGEQTYSIGRVKTRFGLYNEARDVPSSRPSIILPQSIYLDMSRSLFLSVDGVNVSSINRFYNGDILTQLSVGQINFQDNLRENSLGSTVSGSMSEDLAFAFDLKYLSDELTLGFSYSSFEPQYTATSVDYIGFGQTRVPVIDGSFTVDTMVLSALYFWHNLEMSAEYIERSFDINGLIPDYIPADRDAPMEGYYGQLRYALNEQIVTFIRWERFYEDADHKDGINPDRALLQLPRWATVSTTSSFGVQWRISDNWFLNAEYHHVNGSAFLPPLSRPILESLEEKSWDILAAQVVFRF